MRRVVITGMGIVSSIGQSIHTFWSNATQGHSGIATITAYDPSPYPTQVAGEIKHFDFTALTHLEKPHRYPIVTQYALAATREAIIHAALTPQELNPAGVFIGTGLGGMPELESAFEAFYGQQNWRKIPGLSVLRGMPNAISNHIAIEHHIEGANHTFSNACVSSADAILSAFRTIQSGQLAVAIAGGSEALIFESIMAGWCRLRVMSTHNEPANQACRPFNQTRNGFVMAEGAGVITLESLEHAKARGATIFAEILGIGNSCDASHLTAPNSMGQINAINMALKEAKLAPTDVHYINAHGTGTLLNDAVETNTIKEAFPHNAYDIPITAQKAMTGHAIGASGAMEIIATTLSLVNGILLPTINLDCPDKVCDLDYIPNKARQQPIHIALSNHFAFGGSNVVIALGAYDR